MISSLLAVRKISPSTLILKAALYQHEEVHCGPTHAPQMELLERIVNVFKLMLLFFEKIRS